MSLIKPLNIYLSSYQWLSYLTQEYGLIYIQATFTEVIVPNDC